jgi:Family of unknown function (DUF5989)
MAVPEGQEEALALPILLTLVIVGSLMVLAQTSAVAPFIYSLF